MSIDDTNEKDLVLTGLTHLLMTLMKRHGPHRSGTGHHVRKEDFLSLRDGSQYTVILFVDCNLTLVLKRDTLTLIAD